ncbi:MAG: hypothetical protein DSM107014_12380 [Gomphosphaeria aponina SAG 52.96 = DSM 107014]|uniref:Uncharacterized protein n=1 Tax=Gomphosphaeria aponina SAG 52.96 = DSM 107014 TaxID=1521640 RepID=A0A941GW16_9CHRO|nr:hypothetical protein [Gomphosphaeria aponina SAG 52.96 = DSM 107014]
MDSKARFIFKVFILSAGLSLIIKYGGMMLPIGATYQNALLGICLPPSMLALALWWRFRVNS